MYVCRFMFKCDAIRSRVRIRVIVVRDSTRRFEAPSKPWLGHLALIGIGSVLQLPCTQFLGERQALWVFECREFMAIWCRLAGGRRRGAAYGFSIVCCLAQQVCTQAISWSHHDHASHSVSGLPMVCTDVHVPPFIFMA